MDTKSIEKYSINQLCSLLDLNPFLDQNIKFDDKEPSWDGTVIIHGKEGKKKDSIVGRVSVQVKGHEMKKFPDKISESIQIVDLRNYLLDGGVIYIVAYLNSEGRISFYYVTLEPLKIKRLLKIKSNNTTTINVKCKKLPDKHAAVRNIFLNFYRDSKKQISFVDSEPISISDLEEKFPTQDYKISFSGIALKSENVHDIIENSSRFLYVEIPNYPTPIPISEQIHDIIFSEEVNREVSIGNITFYTKYVKETNKNETTFHFGECNEVVFDLKKKSMKVNFENKPYVRQVSKDLDFFIKAYENSGFYVGDNWIDFSASEEVSLGLDLNTQKEYLVICKKFQALLDYFEIERDLNIEKLTTDEVSDLDILYECLINRKTTKNIREDIPLLTNVRIAGLNLLLVFHEIDENSNFRIVDPFRSEKPINCVRKNDEDHRVSIFNFARDTYLYKLDNIIFSEFLESYKKIGIGKFHFDDANELLLKLIKSADLAREEEIRDSFLEAALDFSNWLLSISSSSDDEIHRVTKMINHAQIKKRMSLLERKDMLEILEIAKNDSLSHDFRLSAYLILGNDLEAQIHFEEMSEESKDSFPDYPISIFYKEKEVPM
ncbi:hypothetical protein [Candidatus Enterococcus murrayae]|uniref:DUF4365 domain-containing protein n=1 Tax=Candidatus Enterococcus murrayae TaxID=2815321 RepID=A0ABS3HE24_9ENTE|nr:hypothetical protein [Enterococcus sp. MJM16]MBO0451155.1 hypothetical protein [Enterococcus sp. MJM16]